MAHTSSVDWILLSAMLLLSGAGLSVLASFGGETRFFSRQVVWLFLALAAFFVATFTDWRFLRRTRFAFGAYFIALILLAWVPFAGTLVRGAQSWFDFGAFSFQPVEFAKLALIILLAKYFSRRHIEIARLRHLVVSGAYAFLLIFLLLLQPDFGSAVIVSSLWFGLVFLSGISRKHLAIIGAVAVSALTGLWFFVFTDIQKARIESFLHPLADVQGAGYNALQSVVAVGSGGVWGKGVGYGTQSRLEFLPEYETDFVFAAFAEEWGLLGALLIFALYGVVFWRVLAAARMGETNFETIFALGVAAFLLAHFVIHIGMNIGLLPVTGVTLPFLSYGGSHLLMEFLAFGMLTSMRRRARRVHQSAVHELAGVV